MRLDLSESNFCLMGLVLVEEIVAMKRLLKKLIFGYKADSDTYLAAYENWRRGVFIFKSEGLRNR